MFNNNGIIATHPPALSLSCTNYYLGTLTKTLNIIDSDNFEQITNFFVFKGKLYFYAYISEDACVWYEGYITGQGT